MADTTELQVTNGLIVNKADKIAIKLYKNVQIT